MHYSLVRNCPLFAEIESEQLETLLKCLDARICNYQKDEFIFHKNDPVQYVGVVLRGGVHIIQEDFWGNRNILDHIEQGQLFAESLSCAEIKELPVSVVATEESDIMLIDYRKIVTACSAACAFHSRLISNMLSVLAKKNILLTRKMEFVSQRTTREKLLTFLSTLALQAQSREISIPYNRQELADYLCVDRSALSRELGLMKQEGVLDFEKNRFVLKGQA